MSKTKLVKPRTMAGVMELLPEDQARFDAMLAAIGETYASFGYVPLDTPVMEHTEVLLTKSGGDTEKQVYLVQSTGARKMGHEPELAMRFDLTIPLARYVAEHEHDLAFPFRRSAIGKVYRGESAQRGRYREFYQCDIDVVGKMGLELSADAEMPAILSALLRRLEVGPFQIRLSNRKLLQGLLESLGIEGDEARGAVIREIDKIDKLGLAKVLEILADPLGLAEEAVAGIRAFLEVDGSVAEVLEQLSGLAVASETFATGIEELREVAANLAAMEVPEEDYQIRTSIARGLDYYTGTIYETFLLDAEDLGSICSGGRYENLAGLFTRTQLPGVGLSIGATRLFYILKDLGRLPAAPPGVQVLVTQLDRELRAKYQGLATRLRRAGLRTVFYSEPKKIKKQLTFANKAGIPFVLTIGSNEAEAGVIQVKDLASGEQTEVPDAEVVDFLVARLPAR